MKIEDGIVLQPYGKNEVCVNFIVSPQGKWIFGPSDATNMQVFKENSRIYNYVKFSAKNPKYHVRPIAQNFQVKDIDYKFKPKITHDLTDCKSIFFFMFYEPREDFVAMQYTTRESDFDYVDKNMNILSVVAFYGKNFKIIEENWDHGITVSKNQINNIVDKLKNESTA